MPARTFPRDSWSMIVCTRAALAPSDSASDSRRRAWKVRYSHTVDVPGSTSSCSTYPCTKQGTHENMRDLTVTYLRVLTHKRADMPEATSI